MLFAFAYYVTSNKVYLGWTSVENILMHGGEIGRRSLDYLINPITQCFSLTAYRFCLHNGCHLI